MNNRKQKVESFLNSLTSTEIEEYIEKHKLNNELISMLETIKKVKEPTHKAKINNEIGTDLQKVVEKYYKFGQSYIIAFVLECFYDKEYKIKDLKYYLKTMVEQDEDLKRYVYDAMKDF